MSVFAVTAADLVRLALCMAAAQIGMPLVGREASEPLPQLGSAMEVRLLSPAEAAAGYPVRLKGVITVGLPTGEFFVQDDRAGIFVIPKARKAQWHPGQQVEVYGVSEPGRFAPLVQASQVDVLGEGLLPPAKRVMFEELAVGAFDSLFVEVHGIVRTVEKPKDGGSLLLLKMDGGLLEVFLRNRDAELDPGLVDAVVTIRGAATGRFNAEGQQTDARLCIHAAENIVIDAPAPAEPFATATRPVASLLRFAPEAASGHRVKVSGVVTYQELGSLLFIRDHSRSLEVHTTTQVHVAPGDTVEVVGFPAMGRFSPLLEHAMFRRHSAGGAPRPARSTPQELMSGTQDGNLVEVDAKLVQQVKQAGEEVLVMQAGDAVFDAHLALPPGADAPVLENESRLRLSGICQAQQVVSAWYGSRLQSFRLLLRAPPDIRVVQAPSWWTPKRTRWLLGVTTGVAMISFAGLALLRWRIRRLTTVITEKVSQETAWAERARVAREFHDTLEQELAGLSMQLDATTVDVQRSTAAALGSLELARQMLRHTQADVRESVWSLRSRLPEGHDLPSALHDSAKALTAATAARITVRTIGPSRRLSGVVEAHLLGIGREAVANAIKHGLAREVVVELVFQPRSVRLRIKDDGCGFAPETTGGAAQGHFGLVGMAERAEKIRGTITVHGNPGSGAEIEVEVGTDNRSPDGAEAAGAWSQPIIH